MNIYRLFHPGKSSYLIKTIENHVQLYTECTGMMMWDESGEIQRGLTWRKQLKCDTCLFVSWLHNLYTEVKSNKRGPKTAAMLYFAINMNCDFR